MDAISSDMTGINTQMSVMEKTKLSQQVDAFNKVLGNGKVISQSLGKDDFLKILITQMTTQDPTDPMKDKDSIAQMAQFSALEQMTNMANGFSKVSNLISSSQAVSTLGKTVEIQQGEQTITGVVKEVTPGQFPQVLVGDKFYDYSLVQKIKAAEAN